MTIDELVEAYHVALQRAAKAIAAQASADEQRRIVRAELMVKAVDIPVSKAENIAMASPEYKAAVRDCFNASTEAEEAKAEVEYNKTRFEAWRTKSATARAKHVG